MSNSPQNNRLRRIAILVGSVDSKAASQLLLHLPTEVAKQVRAMSREMQDVSPAERAAILAEFQRSAKPMESPATIAQPTQSPVTEPTTTQQRTNPEVRPAAQAIIEDENLPSWAKLSTEALLRFVQSERTPVVAVIVSQLPPQRGADLLSRLSPEVATAVLRQVGKLQEIDPDAMAAIDEHLATTLDQFQHRIESERENAAKLYALLAAAPSALQSQWAEAIQPAEQSSASTDRQDANRSELEETTPSDSANSADALAGRQESFQESEPDLASEAAAPSADHLDEIYGDSVTAVADEVVDELTEPNLLPFPQVASEAELQYQFSQLLNLPVTKLASLLSAVDTKTVLMGLAGASPEFMERFYRMLQPEDAAALKQRLANIGPLKLREIDVAQQKIVNTADTLEPGFADRQVELRAA